MTVLTKNMTYAEFRALEFDDTDNFQYELLNGELVQKASPTVQHQRISMRLISAFLKHLDQNPVGEIFHAPLDVVLNDYNAPQPDIIFIRKENTGIIDEQEQIVLGAPDILIEILSPGSIKRDRIEKKELYEKFAVPEFWIVDPNNQSIEVYQFLEGRYQIFAFAAEAGTVQSAVLPGLDLDIAPVFG